MHNDYLGSKRRTALIFPYFDLNNKWDSQKSCPYLQSPSRSHSLIGNFNPFQYWGYYILIFALVLTLLITLSEINSNNPFLCKIFVQWSLSQNENLQGPTNSIVFSNQWKSKIATKRIIVTSWKILGIAAEHEQYLSSLERKP